MTSTETLLAEIEQTVRDSLAECARKGGFVEDPEAGPKWYATCGHRRFRHAGVDPSFAEDVASVG